MGALQTGQCDDGKTMDSFLGMRTMQTLRKLPIAAPIRPIIISR